MLMLTQSQRLTRDATEVLLGMLAPDHHLLAMCREGKEVSTEALKEALDAALDDQDFSGKVQEQEIVVQARQEADRIRAEARKQSEQERDLKNQMAELVTITASREELKSNHDKLIAESLASLGRQMSTETRQ